MEIAAVVAEQEGASCSPAWYEEEGPERGTLLKADCGRRSRFEYAGLPENVLAQDRKAQLSRTDAVTRIINNTRRSQHNDGENLRG